MFDYTQDSHFKYGYNNEWFNVRTKPEDQWHCSYGRCQYPPGTFKEEIIKAAKLIRGSTDLPIWVMLSGGADSEVALRAFIEARVAVRAAIIRFKNDYNIHDISYAVIVCETFGIPYRFLDLDIIRFWNEGEYLDYARLNYCYSLAMLTLMWGIDKLDGYPVIGSGECYLEKHVPDDYVRGISPWTNVDPWRMTEKERIAALYRHLANRNRAGAPGFFQYTPEAMYAFLKEPIIEAACNNENPDYHNTLKLKSKVYRSAFPDMVPRIKFDGYERLRDEDMLRQRVLAEQFADCNQVHYTEYHELLNMLAYDQAEGLS